MSFRIGSLETKWKFLVVDNLNESVLGADFIESHHTTSWGISGDKLWLDDLGIPLTGTKNVRMVSEQNHLPVVAKCTVELPPRHQVIIPLRTKDKSCKNGVFEPTKTPGGVLLSKTAVQGGKDGSFWVKAVNLTSNSVTIFKNQRTGTISEIEDMSEPFHLNSRQQQRAVYNINTHTSCAASTLNEIGVDLSKSELSSSQSKQLENLILSYSDIFSKNKSDLGKCNLGVKHHIHLRPEAVPIKQPSRRIPFGYREEVKSNLKAMLNDGIIEKSSSEWASPLVLVRKPSGDLRICVDYRRLNEVTAVTSYPLPNITETLDRLAEASYFTSIDMTSGYHQVEIAEEDQYKTAFISPYGLYQYCRMPFGLAGAPGTFQSVIEDMVQVLDTEDIMAYLDDVICFHPTFEEHLEGITRLFQMVRKSGFKLSGKKCQFSTRSVKFLGHIIDKSGVRPLPEKLEIIRNWKAPKNEADLRQFLGVCTFWRRFVKDFAKVAVPLHNLLNKPEFVWTTECQGAFEALKERLCTSVTLKLPDRFARFSVTCDASDYAVGYYLEQDDKSGYRRPVAFGGRKLTKAETNYSTTEKECLAVIEALKAYRPYLLARQFDLYTDHHSLKWLLTRTKEHSGRLWRWVDKMREFQYIVYHIAGDKNTVADALSRVRTVGTEKGEKWSLDYIRQQQEECPTLTQIKSCLKSKISPLNTTNWELKAFAKELPRCFIGSDGVLRRTNRDGNAQIIIPQKLTSKVLQMMHDDQGHFGHSKTLQRIQDRYFWVHMSCHIEEWCKKCSVCQQRRNPVPANRAPLQSITTRRPGELVTMDIVEYPLSARGYRYCLVMIDHFTKWLELFPLRNQKAETVAKKVFDGWIPRHGAPEQLHHDQGKNLSAKMIEEVCNFLEVWNTRTTPFHPQSDGASERSIRTVNNMLAKVVAEDQRNWDLYVSSSCFAYNTAVHSSTGFSPSLLEFGRELRLPNDLLEPSENEKRAVSHTEYAHQLKTRLTKAFKTAKDVLHTAHKTQKHFYDRWARANVFKEGDLVLWLDRKTRRGRCMKLNRPWTGPWKIIKRLGEVVYRIKYEGSERVGVKRRIVHHDQLNRFHDVREPETAGTNTENLQKDENGLATNDAVVVIDGPDVTASVEDEAIERNNNEREEQPRDTDNNERPQRERRPPDWVVDYHMDF